MPTAIRRLPGDEVHFIAGADLADGQVISHGGLCCVVEGPVKSGDPANGRVKGQYDIASASATTFALGAKVEVDLTTQLAVAAAGGDLTAGVASKAKVSGELVVRVLLNEVVTAPT